MHSSAIFVLAAFGLVVPSLACFGGGGGSACCPPSTPSCAPSMPRCSSASYAAPCPAHGCGAGGQYDQSYPRPLGYQAPPPPPLPAVPAPVYQQGPPPAPTYQQGPPPAPTYQQGPPPAPVYQQPQQVEQVQQVQQVQQVAPGPYVAQPPVNPPQPEAPVQVVSNVQVNHAYVASQSVDAPAPVVPAPAPEVPAPAPQAPEAPVQEVPAPVVETHVEETHVEAQQETAPSQPPTPPEVPANGEFPSDPDRDYENHVETNVAPSEAYDDIEEHKEEEKPAEHTEQKPEGEDYQEETNAPVAGDANCNDEELRAIVKASLESQMDNLEAARKIESDSSAKFGGRFNSIVSDNEFAYVNWYGKRNCQLRVNNRHSLTWED
uniref:Ground-like domain-containing protein n=1 Tax=Steinernema glaseri TaxID=37863 RepID=A0A1I7XW10_9BILA